LRTVIDDMQHSSINDLNDCILLGLQSLCKVFFYYSSGWYFGGSLIWEKFIKKTPSQTRPSQRQFGSNLGKKRDRRFRHEAGRKVH